MAATHAFSLSVVGPLLLSASPAVVAGKNGGRRRRGSFRPRCPATRPERQSHVDVADLHHDFDFQESLKNVQAMLHQNHKNKRQVMTTIDHLKRLGIDHYFQDEIDDAVGACLDLLHSNDLLDTTLSFRLLREAGCDISADEVLRKFVDDNGDFNLDHSKDIRELLSLHDISHLNMGEASLYKAKEFSRKHLTSAIEHLDPNLARYVRQSLDHPYHVSLMQYKARHHLAYVQSFPTRNTAMEKLALAEFQLNKLLHQREIKEVKRWWMGLGLAEEIPAARDQVLKWYMCPMTIVQGQSFSRYRIEITKIISVISIVDDIFDVIATQEELSLFTEAIKMWDLAAADSLPSYMRSCYSALYTITNDIADMVQREHGFNPMDHLKKAVPSLDEYLSNGSVTTGGPLALVHLFFMLGHDTATTDSADLTSHIPPPIISCPSKMWRLWDDMGSAKKDEARDGLDGSYEKFYLRENPGGDAEKHMLEMIEREWEELNRECFSRRTFPAVLTRVSLNLARMMSVLHSYGDEQRLPVLEDYARMLLI